ncbi:hypothetical protein [Joostella sp.]|uniref:hypothetical protein n=1 Tax=Joostella sp. TaxID=2231138 RepID=UPI003A95568D
MKNILKLSFLFIIILSFSCKKESKESNIIELNQAPKDSILSDIPSVECYLYTRGKDSIQLRIENEDNAIIGILNYKFFEKDKSNGTIKGKLNGSIIKADYTYKSEGTTSIREVVFMKKNNTYIPGYGESEEKDGKFVFKNSTKIDFKEEEALKKVDCY